MRWKAERAVLRDGWTTYAVVDAEEYSPHPEALSFILALEAAERSPNTIRSYAQAVATFLTWAQEDGVAWQSVNILDLTRFKRELQLTPSARTRRLRAASTVGLTLTAVTEFLRHCAANGYVATSVVESLVERRWIQPRGGLPRGEGKQFQRTRINALQVTISEQPPEVLSDEQIAAMRSTASTARDRFLLRLLHEAGPRIGEALGIQDEDVHLLPNSRSLGCLVAGPHFHITRRLDNGNQALAKSSRPRHLPVAEGFINDYRDYQHELFQLLGTSHNQYLFVNYRGPAAGRPMTYSNAYQIISRIGHKCGFRATPHMFRHSAASAWINAGSDIDVVQTLLGHSSPTSTSIYLHSSEAKMRAAVNAVSSGQEQQ
ncbi:MAG: tyrosine-type recombinase/integrase [Mycobacteriaceae bacterium]